MIAPFPMVIYLHIFHWILLHEKLYYIMRPLNVPAAQ